MTYQHLSDDEKQYIFDNCETMYDGEMADWIGCSRTVINYYRKKFNKKTKSAVWNQRKPEDIQYLWNIKDLSARQIGQLYNTSPGALRAYISVMRRRGYYFKYKVKWKKEN